MCTLLELLFFSPSVVRRRRLAEQSVGDELPGGEVEPGGQDMHVADDVDPDDVENLPATHMVHAEAPVEAMYLPASHAEHVDSEVAPDCAENLP